MANTLETYDPASIDVIVGGAIMTGFAEEKVRIERDSDAFEDDAGCEGDIVRFATNDKRGTITITLLQTSKSNLILSGLAKADEFSGGGIVPVLVKDSKGKDLYTAPQAWIKKVPVATYRRGVETREWEIRTNNLQAFIGGAA